MTTPDAPIATSTSTEPPFRYTPALAEKIELAWQDEWERSGAFWAANPSGSLTDAQGRHAEGRSPFVVMDMFPYPSGAGLHVGHPLGYIATDVIGRYRRMCGDNVLHALGYDAFGLPAEQYAVQTGQHPRVTTEANIANMRRQLRRMGLAHDDRRSFATIDTGYVRWTQWIFLQIFNSWYDPQAHRPDGGRGAARPIRELEAQFRSGATEIPGHAPGTPWDSLSRTVQRDIIDSFRLAYVDNSPVNWCPGLGTVLANEEVTAEGRSERGDYPVFTRNLRQWKMRITAYADRLADDLDVVNWPDKIRAMQRNWIGRSHGALVRFVVLRGENDASGAEGDITVFTTRPDTLFGATFMVVSPEHPVLNAVPAAWPEGTHSSWTDGHPNPIEAVAAYRAQAAAKSAVDRVADAGKKTGVFTGRMAVNPATGQPIPIFTADYVLMDYGTGAIMAVPGGDERDYAFAQAYNLPVIYTVTPPEGFDGGAWTGDGVVANSSNTDLNLNGMTVPDAQTAITVWLEGQGFGSATMSYRLRDWLYSRQRYWGEPFPIVWDENDQPIALPESALPVSLPDVPDYAPRTFDPDDADTSPEAPLGRNQEWVHVTIDLGDGPKEYRRDTNTMPNWAGSCWYYLRYLNAQESDAVVDTEFDQYWLGPNHNDTVGASGGVDLYVGGVEHAVLHLLYARFWHKVLYDLGHVSSLEPFSTLFNQGYIMAYVYRDARHQPVPAAEVTEEMGADGQPIFLWNGERVTREMGKIGKSLKNVVSPDEMYAAYGADTFRIYEMSMGPLDLSRVWETRAVVGAQRFLQRLWRNAINEETGELTITEDPADEATRRLVHRTIADVRTEMEGMRPNTAIAKLIGLNNHLTGLALVPREALEPLILMTAPFAPHIAEELWRRLGHPTTLTYAPYPQADPAYLVEDSVVCVVQVQGKVRARLEVAPSITEEELSQRALEDDVIQRALDGRGIRKIIVRAPKLVNIVPA